MVAIAITLLVLPLAESASVVGFVLALAITLVFPGTGYYPLLLLLLTDPVVSAWRRARGGMRSTAHMGE